MSEKGNEPYNDYGITEERIVNATFEETKSNKSKGSVEMSAHYILVDTTPDTDTEFQNSYLLNSWLDSYAKMVSLILLSSGGSLEEYLANGKAVIGIYSAQSVSEKDGVRHVYHIIPYVM